jgi:hypothetical protein
MAAARAETTRIKNDAQDAALTHGLKHHELSEQARERIVGRLRQNGGDGNEG